MLIIFSVIYTTSIYSQDLVITEVFAKLHPNDSAQSDANADGLWGNGNPDYRLEDEFIELINNSSSILDISGFQIFEEDFPGIPRHTFPSPTFLNPYQIIVVFGGGTPTGIFNNAIIQLSTSGDFDFDDNGEIITIKDGFGNLVTSVNAISPTNHASVTLSPDISSPFHPNHETLAEYIPYYGDYVSFSPGVFMNGDQSLPIELSKFEVVYKNGNAIINWTTESEINNLGFNIYKSLNDVNNFRKVNLVLIDGAINSSISNNYSYTDNNIEPNKIYYYKLEDVSTSGNTEKHFTVKIQTGALISTLSEYSLSPAYPNPFNPETTINFRIPENANVKINVYDMLGNLVNTLTDRNYSSGQYQVKWNAVDFNNSPVSAGFYIYQLTSNTGFSKTLRMIYLK